ncbi:DNase1 protein [Colletotrichum musicola]|uniref:DNase1 protein n=2 Tax=Colletotrichum orchidearum species complex TaxID=2707337 RepID=A0A8H6KSV0_9PEZI|nr:DNase1 protein [Colletotrichum sojae]KAF6837027.1 DNase1 protein [Colletotrichum musicola]
MQFSTFLALFGSAALAAATNSITFKSLDDDSRTVYFVPSIGHEEIEKLKLDGHAATKVEFPQGWIGNWFSVTEGAEVKPGMLGEVTFNGWNGMTYFDVSAIVNPGDHAGVKMMYPLESKTPTSGCDNYPCPDKAYYQWDDVQTRVTDETELVCTFGNNGVVSIQEDDDDAAAAKVKRDYVLGWF